MNDAEKRFREVVDIYGHPKNGRRALIRAALRMRREAVAEERERCARYVESEGRGRCVTDAAAKSLANDMREGK